MKYIRCLVARALAVALAMFLYANGASAENRAEAVSVGAYVGSINMDNELEYNDGSLLGLFIGYNIDRNLTAELSLTQATMKEHTVPFTDYDAAVNLVRLEALYHFPDFIPDMRKLVPFAAAGIGTMELTSDRPGSGNNLDFAFDFGLGAKYFISRNIALRADLRDIVNVPELSKGHNNIFYAFGLLVQFGGEQTVEEPVPDVAIMEAPPEKQPEPKPEPVKVAPPADSDGDGVPDNLDKCPNTPKGVKVDANGCPVPEKAVVTKQGTYNFGKVYFDFNKSKIKPQSRPVLNEVADYMKKYPDVKLEVQGHTDSVGGKPYNQKLSQARAESVRKYIIGTGIAANRLTAKGYGMSSPVASNRTKTDRAKNRRTEFLPIW